MDKATIDFITKITEQQNTHFEKLLTMREENDNLKFRAVQKSIEASSESVAMELRRRNGIIEQIQKEFCEVKEHTTWWRFFQRNPKVTVIILILVIIGTMVMFGIRINEDGIGVSLFQHILEKLFKF